MTLAPIRCEDVTLAYDRHPAVHHLSGQFSPGSMTAIIGPNGAGKSSLLRALAGRMKPAGGRIDLGRLKPRDIAYMPQQASLDRGFPVSVLELVLLGLWPKTGPFGGIGRKGLQAAREAIAAVGLEGFEQRPLSTLSGGQAQRALFARVLVQDAKVILLDEPFNALDSGTVNDLVTLLGRWQGEQKLIVAVLHDADLVRRHFPETLYLARQPIAWGRTSDVLTEENQRRARAMAESWDEAAAVCAVPTGRAA